MQTVNLKRLFSLRRLTLTVALQLLFVSIFAQVRINGKVTDAEGKAVPFSSVSVKNTRFGASANENGDYSFSANLQPGNYSLVFTASNFGTAERSLQVTSASGSYTVNQQLTASTD